MPVDKQQFPLPFTVDNCQPKKRRPAPRERLERPLPDRVAGLDQVLSTRDVQRITGRHRCTIYRWVRSGTFPEKRAGGGRGWLRSDVERWLEVGIPTDFENIPVARNAGRDGGSA
jgi:predicted DNA-binding transcriptional regulator AlpA